MAETTVPNLIQALGRMTDARLEAAHFAMPASVIAYNSAEQRATVQPIIRRYYTSEEGKQVAEAYPAIEGVPVSFPGSGSFSVTWPLAVGDKVFLIFSEGSLDKWLTYGGRDVTPDDPRRNDFSDAVAYPGIRTFNAPTKQVDSAAMVIAGIMLKLGDKDASKVPATVAELQSVISWVASHTHLYAPGPGSPTPTGPGSNAGVPPAITGALKVRMT